MKKSILMPYAILLMLALGTQILAAQSCPAPPPSFEKSSLQGEWVGQYTHKGNVYGLQVNIQLKGEKLTATLALPDLNIPSSEFTSWVCQSNELHMRLDMPESKAVKFIGRHQNGKLSGRFVFNEVSGVCTVSTESFSIEKSSSSTLKME